MSQNEKTIPYIAIIGGLYNLQEKPDHVEEAKDYARQLGAELAKNKMGLVVYYSDEGSLEPHVVEGYVKALDANAPAGLIRVHFGEAQATIVKFKEEESHQHLFQRSVIGTDWEAPFYRSLVEADSVDGVLLMAGKRSTMIAGQVVLGRGLPVLAIDRFEESAKKIRTELAIRFKDYPSCSTKKPDELIKWLKQECITQSNLRQQSQQYDVIGKRIMSQSRSGLWAGAAALVFLITLVYGLSQSPDPGTYPGLMFFGLMAAGASGALVRAVIWSEGKNSNLTSFILGGFAGIIVGLAYLIPQWVGAPGVLESSATIVEATDKIQFGAAMLVAVSAGVGFDTVFTRLMNEANTVPIQPPPK